MLDYRFTAWVFMSCTLYPTSLCTCKRAARVTYASHCLTLSGMQDCTTECRRHKLHLLPALDYTILTRRQQQLFTHVQGNKALDTVSMTLRKCFVSIARCSTPALQIRGWPTDLLNNRNLLHCMLPVFVCNRLLCAASCGQL